MTSPAGSLAAIPTITVRPSAAADAYGRVDRGNFGIGASDGGSSEFGAVMQRALQGAVDAGRDADTKSAAAISGGGNLTDVVTAVSKAELAMQSATAIRDRVVQAYQDIMRMPI